MIAILGGCQTITSGDLIHRAIPVAFPDFRAAPIVQRALQMLSTRKDRDGTRRARVSSDARRADVLYCRWVQNLVVDLDQRLLHPVRPARVTDRILLYSNGVDRGP